MKATMVLTTINDPKLLEDYFENFKKYGHLSEVDVIIIPDKKTPKETYERAKALTLKGLKTICPTIEEQEEFLRKLNLEKSFIPYNSDNRRNIGYLMSLETVSDFLISIDDDNYCLEDEDYFMKHAIVTNDNFNATVVTNKTNNWYNIMNEIEMDSPKLNYPRGFPYRYRHTMDKFEYNTMNVSIHVNAGLWINDPDVDGITWLVNPSRGTKFKNRSLVLGPNTWSPINTQNTSLRRDAISAYYFVKMNYPLAGIPIDRYGDIFSGYFLETCTKNLHGYIKVGDPITNHKRNSHNYMKDASNEWACILVLEDFLEELTNLKLTGGNYKENYFELSEKIEDIVEKFSLGIWNDTTKGYFHQMAYSMRVWLKAIDVIEG